MTIKEAASLVLQTLSLTKSGDIFILEMGEPVKIYDLAKKMINLYGLDVVENSSDKKGIEIIFTGLRSGEKKYEELLVSGNEKSTDNDQIFRDECSSKLSQEDFSFIKEELHRIINSRDLQAFKELSAKYAEYGEETS